MRWWTWTVMGIVLIAIELVSPGGFFIIFFGAGAVLVGLAVLAGLADATWIQWLLFSVASVLALLAFRNPLLRLMRSAPSPPPVDSLVGEIARALEPIAAGEIGRVELRGTVWHARNVAAAAIVQGERCTVSRVDGLQLGVQPEGKA